METKAPALALISTGMITAIGANTTMSAAAVNAGISSQTESHYFNKRNKPIRLASIPEGALDPLDNNLDPAVEKCSENHWYLVRIAAQALRECLECFAPNDPVPVFLACPEVLPNTSNRVRPSFLKHLQIQSKANIDLTNSKLTYTGRAGGLEMIELAFKFLDATGRDFVLVGGVDSYRYCLQQLSILDSEDRLLVYGSGDGFIPGDAGGFLLLASPTAVQKYQLSPLLNIACPACDHEPGHRYSEEPYRGDGLAAAFRKALANAPGAQIDAVYSSMNGESLASKELGVAMVRNAQRFVPNTPIKHPADCFGDIGAAFGPVLLGLMSKTKACSSLAYCSADGPYRSAVVAWK